MALLDPFLDTTGRLGYVLVRRSCSDLLLTINSDDPVISRRRGINTNVSGLPERTPKLDVIVLTN